MPSNISNQTVTIYVRLLDEGTPTSRPTKAVEAGPGWFRLLATPNYDTEDEHGEFPPGSLFGCEIRGTRWKKHTIGRWPEFRLGTFHRLIIYIRLLFASLCMYNPARLVSAHKLWRS